MTREVDIVCCWVRLDDEYYENVMHHKPFATNKQAFSKSRYRDNGELEHSFRALKQFAPWARRIHIVTNGQRPPAVITEDPKVNVVHHEQFFRDAAALPVFNYHAIEANLCFIDGLADFYINTADDFFLGRPLRRRDVMTDDGLPLIYLEDRPYPLKSPEWNIWLRNLASTGQAIAKVYGEDTRHAFTHTPFLFNRTLAADVWQIWEEELAATSRTKFRDKDDVIFRLLYTYHVLHGVLGYGTTEQAIAARKNVAVPGWDKYRFVAIGDRTDDWRRKLTGILEDPPCYFCLNDHIANDPAQEREAADAMQDFFRRFSLELLAERVEQVAHGES